MNYIKVAPETITDEYLFKVAIIIAGKNVPAVVSLTILAVMLYGR